MPSPTSTKVQISYFEPDAPVADLSGNLPHWRQDGATYFVTFRLADALPQEKLAQWRQEQNEWMRQNPEPHTPEQRADYFERFPRRLQFWLDAGYGSRILAIPEVKLLVQDSLQFFDGNRYQLDEFTIASNHVHVLVTPLAQFELSDILHSWKSFTAHKILKLEAAFNRLQQISAHIPNQPRCKSNVAAASRRKSPSIAVWQKESFDHIVRSAASLDKFRAYIRAHNEFKATSNLHTE